MKKEEQVREKLKELQADLKKREARWNPFISYSKNNAICIEFLKNNISFIKWMLDEPCCKCCCNGGNCSVES